MMDHIDRAYAEAGLTDTGHYTYQLVDGVADPFSRQWCNCTRGADHVRTHNPTDS